MELNRIDSLLEKYENGETTLKEERQLQEFFTTGEVPPRLWEYKMIFRYASREKATTYTNNIKVGPKKYTYAFIGIAASILLAIGIFSSTYYNQQEDLTQHNLGTIEDPEEAYLKTKEALQMVAEVFNTGKEELQYVDEFSNTTNKYLNK